MITHINGTSTQGLGVQAVVKKLRGRAGTELVLTVRRDGNSFKKYVTRALLPTKETGETLAVRSLAYRQLGRLEDAKKDAKKAFSLAPSNRSAQMVMAAAHLDNHRYDDAIRLLVGIKDSTAARVLEATAYAKKGNTSKALEIYTAIPRDDLSPTNVPVWTDRRALLLVLEPVAVVHRAKARQFEAQGRFQEALKEYAAALALAADDKDEETIRSGMFRMVRRMSRVPKLSEEAYRHAIRGELLAKQGNYKEATSEFTQAIRLAPFAAKLYYNMALINAKAEGYSEAMRYMKIYLQAAPDAPNARAAKGELIKWELRQEQKK